MTIFITSRAVVIQPPLNQLLPLCDGEPATLLWDTKSVSFSLLSPASTENRVPGFGSRLSFSCWVPLSEQDLELLLPPCNLLALDLGAACCFDCVVHHRNVNINQCADFFRRKVGGCCLRFLNAPLAIPGFDGGAASPGKRGYQSCLFRHWF